MPDLHRVILTAAALVELEEIADFIRRDSPQNAAAVATELLDAMDSLTLMPSRYRRVARSRRGTAIHALTVRPFVMYYRVNENPATVYILRIVHGARRQPRRFE